MRRLALIAFLVCSHAAVAPADDDDRRPALPIVVASPDGRIRVDVFVDKLAEHPSAAQYRIFFRGQPVVLASRLGTDLAGGATLGADSVVESVERRSFRETYEQFPGKRTQVLDHGSEAVIGFRERTAPARRWELVVRAYDDGAAVRYRFPAQQGWQRLEIAAERTGFELPGDPTVFAMPLPSFTTPHEEHYRKSRLSEFPQEALIGLPLLAELPGTGWAAILEVRQGEGREAAALDALAGCREAHGPGVSTL
jgi:alpha-glucosidase